MVAASRRCLALALVAACLLPAGLAVGLALHLDHHHTVDHSHVETMRELAAAAAHGHSHDLGAPGHEHSAARDAWPPPVVTTVSAVAHVVASATPPPATWRAAPEPGQHRPPPVPLFTLHCALLS